MHRFKVGDRVRCERMGLGTIVNDDRSDLPLMVRFDGGEIYWFYRDGTYADRSIEFIGSKDKVIFKVEDRVVSKELGEGTISMVDSSDMPYHVMFDNGRSRWYYRDGSWTGDRIIHCEEEETEFKIGDRVISNDEKGCGTIVATKKDDSRGLIGVRFDKAGDRLHDLDGECPNRHGWWYFEDGDGPNGRIRLAPSEVSPRVAKVGDRVRVIGDNGGPITAGTEWVVGNVLSNGTLIVTGGYTISPGNYTVLRGKPAPKTERTSTRRPEIGDKIRIIKPLLESDRNYYGPGDILMVKIVDSDGDVRVETSRGIRFVCKSEFVLLEKEPTPATGGAQVGDKIRVVAATGNGKDYENGDVLTVRCVEPGGVMVKEHNRALYHSEYTVICHQECECGMTMKAEKPKKPRIYTPGEIEQARRIVMEITQEMMEHYKIPVFKFDFEEKTTNVKILMTGGCYGDYADGEERTVKCSQGDVFDKWIGRMVALCKSQRMELPGWISGGR